MTEVLTEKDIRLVVDSFYNCVRSDALLGPVFATRIQDADMAWRQHQDHIADFWSSIFLKTGRFNGNPMEKHASLVDITPEHFDHWLYLFTKTTRSVLPQNKAEVIIEMARRIARSLQMGLAFNRDQTGETDHPFSAYSALSKHSQPESLKS